MTGYRNSQINCRSIGMHHRKPLPIVGGKDLSVLPHVRVEDQNHSILLGTIQQALIHDARVFNPPTCIGARIFLLRALDGRQNHVKLAVPIGVGRHLPSGIPPLLVISIELFLTAGRGNAKLARPIRIRLAKPCRASTQRVALKGLEGRNAEAIVTKASLDSGGLEFVERSRTEHESDADRISEIAQLLHQSE